MKLPTITNITEIRRSPKHVFDSVIRRRQPTVVVRKSKAVAVILDPASYEAMLASDEDRELLQDSLDLQAAIRSSSGRFIDARKLLEDLERDQSVPRRSRIKR